MMRFLAIIVYIGIPSLLFGQQQTTDTISFYKDLYGYSKDRPFLYQVYRAIFNVPPDPVNAVIDKRDGIKQVPDSLVGRSIRAITVVAFEPFGTKVTDTLAIPHSFVQKAGNALHINSQRHIIRNYLLFSEGQPLDLFKVAESERLLRQSEFLRDAVISASAIPGAPDSVDVQIFSQDLWTFEVSLTLTTTNTRVRFTEYNFLGLGHRFRNKIEYHHYETEKNPFLLDGSYLVPNIGSTYIATGVRYLFSPDDDQWGAFLERPFFSALANWAGGVSYNGRKLRDSIRFAEQPYDQFSYLSNTAGAWLGRSFPLKKGLSPEEQSTRMVFSGGYTRTRYHEVNSSSADVKSYFLPMDLYLVSTGFSNRRYFTDRYILDFGEKEDVPTGRFTQITAGYEVRGIKGRLYTGFSLGGSGYVGNSGYFSAHAVFGGYYDEEKLTQGVAKVELFAFSRLFRLGKWRMRWFGYSGLTYGLNRLSNETISLIKDEGIPGYKYQEPAGTSRFSFSMRMLFFNPFEIIGFRFTPLLFGGIGMIGDEGLPLYKSRVYTGYGAGFAITNVYLVDSDFELLIGFYPAIPGSENTGIRINPVDVWSFSFRDYTFGKPDVILFE